jgi:proteasome lid subunit RPN8/RPN11
MLEIPRSVVEEMVAHCLAAYPLEACGLVSGWPEGAGPSPGAARVEGAHPADNLARSSRVYELDPRALLRTERAAEAQGMSILGVYHSHTHTEARPSPTDIAQAPDPEWHYLLVSLRDQHPSVRSWRIWDGNIKEERLVLK